MSFRFLQASIIVFHTRWKQEFKTGTESYYVKVAVSRHGMEENLENQSQLLKSSEH